MNDRYEEEYPALTASTAGRDDQRAPLCSLADLQAELGCTQEQLGAIVWSDLIQMVQVMAHPSALIRERVGSGNPFCMH